MDRGLSFDQLSLQKVPTNIAYSADESLVEVVFVRLASRHFGFGKDIWRSYSLLSLGPGGGEWGGEFFSF